MKAIFTLSLSLILLSAFAQDINVSDSIIGYEKIDTFNYNSVLVVPLDLGMYFSDADNDLAEYNDLGVIEVRQKLQSGISSALTFNSMQLYPTRNLLKDTAKTAPVDMKNVHDALGYQYMTPFNKFAPEENAPISEHNAQQEGKFWGKFKGSNPEETESMTSQKDPIVKDITDKKYIGAKVHNVAMLEYLGKTYGTDLILFITQVEVVTNYQHCLDRTTNNYARDLKIHYSLYDLTGDQKAGGSVVASFDSNTRSITDIIRNFVYPVAMNIVGKFPMAKKKTLKEPVYFGDQIYEGEIKNSEY